MNVFDTKIAEDNTLIVVDTGWRCSICLQLAQVMMAGETMCVEHAKRWNHGYGESIKQMKDELQKESHDTI
jgi:hypothetical protein